MASQLFEAQVEKPHPKKPGETKKIGMKLAVCGIPDSEASDDAEVYDEEWVAKHIKSHLHKTATKVDVKALRDQKAPATTNDAILQAAAETQDPKLQRVAAKLQEKAPSAAEPSSSGEEPAEDEPTEPPTLANG